MANFFNFKESVKKIISMMTLVIVFFVITGLMCKSYAAFKFDKRTSGCSSTFTEKIQMNNNTFSGYIQRFKSVAGGGVLCPGAYKVRGYCDVRAGIGCGGARCGWHLYVLGAPIIAWPEYYVTYNFNNHHWLDEWRGGRIFTQEIDWNTNGAYGLGIFVNIENTTGVPNSPSFSDTGRTMCYIEVNMVTSYNN